MAEEKKVRFEITGVKWNVVEFYSKLIGSQAYTYTIEVVNGSVQLKRDKTEDELAKSKEGNPKLK